MTRDIAASAGGVRDVNCTCNVMHVSRSAQFNTSDVLKQIVLAQDMLTAGQTLPPSSDPDSPNQTGMSWIGDDWSDVTACSWVKDVESPVGVLSVQLKPSSRQVQYLDLILPGDLLIVFMDDAGDYDPSNRVSGTLITVVVVDRVAQNRHVENSATVDVVSVSARDLAVVLSESSTVFDQAFAIIENGMYTGSWMNQLFGNNKQHSLSPMEAVLNLLIVLFDALATATTEFPKGSVLAHLQWKLSPSGSETALDDFATLSQVSSLMDITTYVQNPMPFYALAKPPAIVQAGNVWSLLQSYANTVLNEFFIDVRDNTAQERQFRDAQSKAAHTDFFDTVDGPADEQLQNDAVAAALKNGTFASTAPDGKSGVALVMRQRPYDQAAFDNLPYTVVDATEVEFLEVARSSHDVLNWFRLKFPDLPATLQEVVAGIRIIPQSIAKFGYRRLDAETIYMFTSSQNAVVFKKGNTKTDFSDVFETYMDILTDWYSQNDFWLAGTMTMRFKPSIRAGTKLKFTRDGQLKSEFYIQGVQQSFSKEAGASRTSLTITRGRATTPAAPAVLNQQHDGFGVDQEDPNG